MKIELAFESKADVKIESRIFLEHILNQETFITQGCVSLLEGLGENYAIFFRKTEGQIQTQQQAVGSKESVGERNGANGNTPETISSREHGEQKRRALCDRETRVLEW